MVLLRVGNSGSHLQTSFTTHPSRGIITEHIDQLAEKDSNGHSIKALERWETLRELGKGGFGSVDLQVCIQGYRSGELRAVKRLRKPEGEEAKMIRREMGILDSVSPFIPELYDDAMHAMFNAGSSKHFVHSSGWYESDTELFLTMEYLPHGDLEGYLKRLNGVPVPEDEVKTILRQVLGCLEILHSQSYAHRDIKPANILIAHPGPEWHIKLSDFGISALDIREEYDRDKLASIKVYDHDDPRPCSDGEVPNAAGLKKNQDWSAGLKTFIGTPEYMAPEIHRMRWNGGAYGREADLWSVGVLAYRMLTGSRLPLDFVMACRYWESGAPPALKFPANIGTGARLFIRNLLHPDPAQRPLACEFLDAFWLRYDSAPAPIARGVGHHESEGKGSPTLSTARRTSTASLDVLLLPDTERLQGVNASLRGTMHRLMDSEAVSEMERERTEANRRLNWLKSELDLKWEGVDIGRLCDLIMSDNPLDEHQGWVDQVRRLRTRIAKKLERGEGDDHERLSADATAVEKALHVNQAAFERNAEIVIRPREPLVEVQNAGLGLHGQSPQLMSLMTDQWQQYDLTAGSDYEATVYKEWTE